MKYDFFVGKKKVILSRQLEYNQAHKATRKTFNYNQMCDPCQPKFPVNDFTPSNPALASLSLARA